MVENKKTPSIKRTRDGTSVGGDGTDLGRKHQAIELQKATLREKKELSELIKNGSKQVAFEPEPRFEEYSDRFVRVVRNGVRIKFAYSHCCGNLYSQPLTSFTADLIYRHGCPDVVWRSRKKRKRGGLNEPSFFVPLAFSSTSKSQRLNLPTLTRYGDINKVDGIQTNRPDPGSVVPAPIESVRSNAETTNDRKTIVRKVGSSSAMSKRSSQVNVEREVSYHHIQKMFSS